MTTRDSAAVKAGGLRDRSGWNMALIRKALMAGLIAAGSGAAFGQAVPVAPQPVVPNTPITVVPPIVRSPVENGANGRRLQLTPVEQGVADVDAIATSLRRIELGLQEPRGFEGLYLVPGRSDLFMRADGGLYAVFPQSVYGNYKGKALPLVPNDTTFYIGQSAIEALAAPPAAPTSGAPASDDRVNGRIDSRVKSLLGESNLVTAADELASPRAGSQAGVSIGSRVAPVDQAINSSGPMISSAAGQGSAYSIVTDSRYRADRMRALLLRAVRAEAASNSDPAQRPHEVAPGESSPAPAGDEPSAADSPSSR